MNIVDRIGKKQIEKVLAQRTLPDFAPGDTVRVDVKVVEGERELRRADVRRARARHAEGGAERGTRETRLRNGRHGGAQARGERGRRRAARDRRRGDRERRVGDGAEEDHARRD